MSLKYIFGIILFSSTFALTTQADEADTDPTTEPTKEAASPESVEAPQVPSDTETAGEAGEVKTTEPTTNGSSDEALPEEQPPEEDNNSAQESATEVSSEEEFAEVEDLELMDGEVDEYHIPKLIGFEQGAKEVGLGLATAGYGDYFYFGMVASFGYYLVNNFAAGVEVNYSHVFSDFDYPETFTLMPFIKYVFQLSDTVAPYAIVSGGREFEWAGEYDVNNWFVGGGIGAHIALGKTVALKFQVLFVHHWYDEIKVYGRPDAEYIKTSKGEFYCGPGYCDPNSPQYAGDDVREQYDSPDSQLKVVEQDSETGGVGLVRYDPENTEHVQQFVMGRYSLCPEDGGEAKCLKRERDPGDREKEWLYPIINFGLSVQF